MNGELAAGHGKPPAAALEGTPPAQPATTTGHAPLPWRVEELRGGFVNVLDARGETVLFTGEATSPRDLANLELIVAKVNAGLPEVVAWEGGGIS